MTNDLPNAKRENTSDGIFFLSRLRADGVYLVITQLCAP